MFFLKNKALVLKLFTLFYPFKKRILLILGVMLVSAGINMLFPSLSKIIMDEGLLAGDFRVVITFTLWILGLYILDRGLNMVETMLRVRISTMLPYGLEKRALDHAMKLPISYYSRTNVTEMMSTISSDVDKMAMIADRSIFLIVMEFFRIMGGIAGLVMIDWRLTLVVMGIIPIKYYTVKILAEKRERLFEKFMIFRKAYASWYGDTLAGVKEIKLFGAKRKVFSQFMRKKRELIDVEARMDIVDQLNFTLESTLFKVLTSVLYIVGAYYIFFQKSLTVGGLFAFISYSIYVTDPIGVILEIGYAFSSIMPSAKRYFAFMEENETEETHIIRGMPIRLEEIKGAVTFKNVSFSYNGENSVLKDLNFKIRPEETVAIIGPNGSGKTTLFNMIARFYRPDTGNIFLDDTPIDTFSLDGYRSILAVVSQRCHLFHTTVKENIALSRNVSDDLMVSAARHARAHEFIQDLPDLYDTVIGNNGSTLSGGQHQKIALARAMLRYRSSKILLFDEASAAFDVQSESALIQSLQSPFFNDKTILMITHREKILLRVDRIIMLKDGKIEAMGTHSELFGHHPLYQTLVAENHHG